MTTRVKGSVYSSVDTTGFICITDAPYLCVGDNVTDNTAALALAFSAGTPLLVPPGIFLATSLVIPSGTVIFGIGPDSVLKVKNATNTYFLDLWNVTNVCLQNFSINGNKTAQIGANNHAIRISAGSKHKLADLSISNTLGNGIYITGNAAKIDISYPKITGYVASGIAIENASDVEIINPECYSSDALAFPGDGITLAPIIATDLVTRIQIAGGRLHHNVGRGLAAVGFGGKNVTDSSVTGTICDANTSHGIHLLTVKQIDVRGIVSHNLGDGFRLEGDVTNCCIAGVSDTNTGFGCREVVAGSTPDYNTFIAVKSIGNGTNTVTKVGANSTILV